MAKTLGPIRYTAPPSGGEDFRGITQGIDALSGLVQNLHIGKVTGNALEDVDAAVKDSLAAETTATNDLSGIKPADELDSDLAFASQYSNLRNRIANTSGSVRTRAIMEAKTVIADHMRVNPALQTHLAREFNAYISSSPELTQAAMIDASREQNTAVKDHVERIEAITVLDWDKGGYGIREDIPIGSLRWAKEFRIQAAKRAEHDSILESVAIRKAKGELKGPEAVIAAQKLLNSDVGDVQGVMRDVGNRMAKIEQARVEGKLVPADQEAWEADKPAIIRDLTAKILKVGTSAQEVFLSDADIMSDKPSYNAIISAVDTAQADLTTLLDAIKNDDFSILDQMKLHNYINGSRIIDKVPLLRSVVDVEAASDGLFSKQDGGIVNALKAFKVATEEDMADAFTALHGEMLNVTGDGATTGAEDPVDYATKRQEAKAALRIDQSDTQAAKIRKVKEKADGLTTHLSSIEGPLSEVKASQGLTMFGAQWEALGESKTYIGDSRDQARIRTLAAHPQVERLALAAVKHNLPGLALESEHYANYWRKTSDSKDLDSFEKWHTEIAKQANEKPDGVPFVTNILEVTKPLDYKQIETTGEINLVVDESKIEIAVRADRLGAGMSEANIVIAVSAAKREARQLSAEATKFLTVRSNRNITENKLEKPDYLAAFYDPITGLDKIFEPK